MLVSNQLTNIALFSKYGWLVILFIVTFGIIAESWYALVCSVHSE